jgi:DNA modification methylase
MMELNKIYLGDSLDLLKLPDNSVDLVITTIFYNEKIY